MTGLRPEAIRHRSIDKLPQRKPQNIGAERHLRATAGTPNCAEITAALEDTYQSTAVFNTANRPRIKTMAKEVLPGGHIELLN